MNKREQGHEYRVQTMIFLARTGYGSTRQVARAVWRGGDMSSRKMASRTLRWLLEQGYIVTKRDGGSVNGEQLSAVTSVGAAWIAEHGEPLPGGKAHARDWLRHAHAHRTACNSVYAAKCGMLDEERLIWSELEVRAKIAPIHQFAYTFDEKKTVKIPDLLAKLANGGYEWIEVENNWRSETDLKKMIACMRAMFWGAQTRFSHVHFVITAPGAKSIGQRLRRAMTHDLHSGEARQIKELDARILREHLKVSTLDPETLELKRVEF